MYLPARDVHGPCAERATLIRGSIQRARFHLHILQRADAVCAGRREPGARAADGDIPFTIQCISAVRIFPCLDIDCAVLHQNAALRSPDGVVPLRGVQAYLAVSQHHRGAGARTARTDALGKNSSVP